MMWSESLFGREILQNFDNFDKKHFAEPPFDTQTIKMARIKHSGIFEYQFSSVEGKGASFWTQAFFKKKKAVVTVISINFLKLISGLKG